MKIPKVEALADRGTVLGVHPRNRNFNILRRDSPVMAISEEPVAKSLRNSGPLHQSADF